MNTVSASNMSILSINATSNKDLETTVKLKVMTKSLVELEKMIINLKKNKRTDDRRKEEHHRNTA